MNCVQTEADRPLTMFFPKEHALRVRQVLKTDPKPGSTSQHQARLEEEAGGNPTHFLWTPWWKMFLHYIYIRRWMAGKTCAAAQHHWWYEWAVWLLGPAFNGYLTDSSGQSYRFTVKILFTDWSHTELFFRSWFGHKLWFIQGTTFFTL